MLAAIDGEQEQNPPPAAGGSQQQQQQLPVESKVKLKTSHTGTGAISDTRPNFERIYLKNNLGPSGKII
jgi:hypothetical protein